MVAYLEAVNDDVRSKFGTLTLSGSSVTVVHSNDSALDPSATYAVVNVGVSNNSQQTMGTSKRFRATGEVLCELWVPIATGENDVEDLVENVTNLFIAQTSTVSAHTIRYQPAPAVLSTPIREEGHWSRTVRIPFTVDYFVT
tara:strand:- start:773 stop:1198 length:426 start_codon:yes stop_codon:yes gene_type:complete